MIRDPLLRKIRERLAEKGLDAGKFQLAMGDLLRREYRGLAIMTGGSDAGADGLVADAGGDTFLVCTTDEDVESNLRQSIAARKRTYPTAGGRAPQPVVVTSHALTNPRKRKLEKIAREEGFKLLNVHDHEDVAVRLWYAPRWRKELLGITGAPSALAAVPAAGRYPVRVPLLGREADRRWLFECSGDRLLLGVPGAGKTALVRELVEEGQALFLRREASREEIADAWRELKPPVVILDDAHTDQSVIERLRTVRQDILAEGEFSILATSWPGRRPEVADALGLESETCIRKLELLTRDEIVQLYAELGVEADERWKRELVDQAANRPGLAVTLAQLWKQGAWREIVEGSALSRFVEVALRRLVGEEAEEILAAFSLGGKRGVSKQVVGKFLELSLPTLVQRTAALGSAGILSVEGSDVLAVEPSPLRAVLLARTFLNPSGTRRLPGLEDLLERVPSPSAGVEAILLALRRGGSLPASKVQKLLLRHESARAWELYADLGEPEARWALDQHSDHLEVIIRPLLKRIPAATLSRLLASDLPRDGIRPENAYPLRAVRDWVSEFDPDDFDLDTHLERRAVLVAAVVEKLRRCEDQVTALQALCLAFLPDLANVVRDPGMGNWLTETRAVLPARAYPRLEQLWEKVLPELAPLDVQAWKQLRSLLFQLLHVRAPGDSPEQRRREEAAVALARRVAADLVPLAAGRPGVSLALRRMGAPVEAEADPLLDLLFPERPGVGQVLSDWMAEQRGRIADLAESWSGSDPQVVAARLATCSSEGSALDSYRGLSDLVDALAEAVTSPLEWLEVFSRSALPVSLTSPFLSAAVRRQAKGWREAVANALDGPLRRRAAKLVLRAGPPLDDLVPRAIAVATTDADLMQEIEGMAASGYIPSQTLRRLLDEAPGEVSLAAAIGHWCAEPQGAVQRDLETAWRRVILGAPTLTAREEVPSSRTFWLGEILASSPDLAFEWLRTFVGGEQSKLFRQFGHDLAARALGTLSAERRIALLAELSLEGASVLLVRDLVSDDPAVFRALLRRPDLREVHLEPMRGLPDDTWWVLAKIAREEGKRPREVAEAAFGLTGEAAFGLTGASFLYSGPGAAVTFFDGRVMAEAAMRGLSAFESRLDSPDPDLAAIAQEGKDIAVREVEWATVLDREIGKQGL